jgi:DNA processing protein
LQYKIAPANPDTPPAHAAADEIRQPAATHPQLQSMGFDPVAPDALAQRCQKDIQTIHADLLALELDGRIELLPGGLYQRLN